MKTGVCGTAMCSGSFQLQSFLYDRTACVVFAGRALRATSSRSPPPPKAVASVSAGLGGGVTTSARLMRRSASFDTIASFYLAGRWPCREPSVVMASLINGLIVLTVDKSTQVNTADVNEEPRAEIIHQSA